MKNRDNKLPNSVILMSLLVAFYADIKCVNWSLTYGFIQGRESGFMSLLYPSVFFLILAVVVFYKSKIHNKFSYISVFLIAYLIFFYLITQYSIGPPRVQFVQFFAMVILGLCIPNIIRVDTRIMLKAVMSYPAFAVLRLSSIFFMANNWKDYISMDASYAFLTPIMATYIYLFFYFKPESKKQKMVTIFLSLVNFIFFLQLFKYGSRGPLLCLLLLSIFMWIVKPKVHNLGLKANSTRIMITVVSLIIVVFSIEAILSRLDSVLRLSDYNIYSFNKILRLTTMDNLSNGRDILYAETLSWISERPLFGHGFDRFDSNTGLGYPHNFILQILYDGGLIFFMILIFPIIVRLIKKYKNCSTDEYAMLSFLMFSSVPYALLSQDMWLNTGLWLFFGAVLSKSFVFSKVYD